MRALLPYSLLPAYCSVLLYAQINVPTGSSQPRLTFGWLLLLLTCVRSLGRYAWYPFPAARLSESAGSRVGELD
mgnify:CR=1 FL=1